MESSGSEPGETPDSLPEPTAPPVPVIPKANPPPPANLYPLLRRPLHIRILDQLRGGWTLGPLRTVLGLCRRRDSSGRERRSHGDQGDLSSFWDLLVVAAAAVHLRRQYLRRINLLFPFPPPAGLRQGILLRDRSVR